MASTRGAARSSTKKSSRSNGRSSANDAIAVLKADHETVEKLFKRFEGLGERADKTRRQVVDKIVEELSIHASIEEMVFYPIVRELSSEIEEHVLESLEEHHVVKWLVSEIDGMPADHERFKAKVMVLIENTRHHVKEEEKEFFPLVRKAADREMLVEMGDALRKAKKVAPTRPHPRSPDEPPGNVVTGLVSGMVDRLRQAGRQAVGSR